MSGVLNAHDTTVICAQLILSIIIGYTADQRFSAGLLIQGVMSPS